MPNGYSRFATQSVNLTSVFLTLLGFLAGLDTSARFPLTGSSSFDLTLLHFSPAFRKLLTPLGHRQPYILDIFG